MLIIESILGNIRDKQWQDRAGKAKVDYLILNQWDAQKTACVEHQNKAMTLRFRCPVIHSCRMGTCWHSMKPATR